MADDAVAAVLLGEVDGAVGALEGAEAEPAFDRSTMLAQRRVTRGIVGEGVGRAADLGSQHGEHRRRRHLTGFNRPTGMAEITELHRITDPVGGAPAPEHLDQIVGAERVQSLDRGEVRWWIEQRGALRRRQDVRDHLDPVPPAVTQSCRDDVDAT